MNCISQEPVHIAQKKLRLEINQLLLCWKIIALRSENYIRHKTALSGQNVEIISTKFGGKYGNH